MHMNQHTVSARQLPSCVAACRFGQARSKAEEYLSWFETSYWLQRLEVAGDDVRVLRGYPLQWQVRPHARAALRPASAEHFSLSLSLPIQRPVPQASVSKMRTKPRGPDRFRQPRIRQSRLRCIQAVKPL